MPARRWVLASLVVALEVGCSYSVPVNDGLDAGRADAASARLDAGIHWPDAVYVPPDAFYVAPDAFFEPVDAFAPRVDGGPGRLEGALGPTIVTAPTPPPPLSGGTLIISRDDRFAIAGDPDRDRVSVVDLATLVATEVPLLSGDEPGRLVDDGRGQVHVALRRGGAVATIDLATRTLVGRRAVCPTPRGIAWDASTDRLHVACASGELVTLPTTLDAPTRTLHLSDDLRDVVVVGGEIFVSRFRGAQVLVVDDATGRVTHTIGLPGDTGTPLSSAVAWRMIPSPLGGVTVVYQIGRDGTIDPTVRGAYGSAFGCGSVVLPVVTEIHGSVVAPTPPRFLPGCTVLPVDAAFGETGMLFVVAAGAAPLSPTGQVVGVTRNAGGTFGSEGALPHAIDPGGRVIAIAATATGIGVTQVREPAGLWVERRGDTMPTLVPLGGASVADTGFEMFHSNVGIGLACASCHPEGGDDGRVWNFTGVGPRRTMSLRGGILGTEPFHWSGDLATFDALMDDVFAGRMGGGALSPEHTAALSQWIDTSPLLPPRVVADPAAVARGQALFESAEVGCTDCHSGERFSNEASMDVGTGGLFQVPRLRGVGYRAPYLHTGCAPTLRDRFTPSCGGAYHGATASLTSAQIDDMVAYLETL